MTTKPTANEIERQARLVQADLAIEGFQITLEEAIRIGRQFYDSNAPETIDYLIRKARAENRPDLDVVTEHFAKTDPPEDPD